MDLRAINLYADMDRYRTRNRAGGGRLDRCDLEFRARGRALGKKRGRRGDAQDHTPNRSHGFIYAFHGKKIQKLRRPPRALFDGDRPDDESARRGWVDARFGAL
jgi:hypothetical protein